MIIELIHDKEQENIGKAIAEIGTTDTCVAGPIIGIEDDTRNEISVNRINVDRILFTS